MRSSDNSISSETIVILESLGGAKVDEKDLAAVVDYGVLGLDVPVDDALGVQVLDC
jgi:hypothetical protein